MGWDVLRLFHWREIALHEYTIVAFKLDHNYAPRSNPILKATVVSNELLVSIMREEKPVAMTMALDSLVPTMASC